MQIQLQDIREAFEQLPIDLRIKFLRYDRKTNRLNDPIRCFQFIVETLSNMTEEKRNFLIRKAKLEGCIILKIHKDLLS